jgi:type I restriction enzyme S subunit
MIGLKLFFSVRVEDGLQIIRIQDLRENDNAETNYCNFEVKDKYYVYNNDLLFCWAGNIKTSLGAYIWNKDKAVLNQHIYNMKPKTNLSKSYYRFLINKFLPLLKNYTGGSAGQVHITKGDFKTFDVPVPPLEEQKKISSILSSVDSKIQKEEEYKAKLERLKKGLMQKLLTGEIRVNTEMEV